MCCVEQQGRSTRHNKVLLNRLGLTGLTGPTKQLLGQSGVEGVAEQIGSKLIQWLLLDVFGSQWSS
jgi:hypothetical protein